MVIKEGLDIINKKVTINHSHKNILDTRLGKGVNFKPRKSKLGDTGVVAYSAYTKKDKNILLALKGKSQELEVDDEVLGKLIKRAAIFFYRVLKSEPLDLIITMESKSELGKKFLEDLTSQLHHSQIEAFKDGVEKDLSDIQVSKEGMMKNPAYLKNVLQQVKDTGKLNMKSIVPQYRKFIVNWVKVKQELTRKIKGKHIILIDDYITTGTTLTEAVNALKKYEPASIKVLALVK